MKARLFFVSSSAIVICFALWFVTHFGARAVEPATLIIASDLHYIAPDLTDRGSYFQQIIENADGKAMEYSEELIEAFTDQVIEQNPDALILSGDLTFNGARLSHESLTDKLRRIKEAGIPVFVIPGNHDLENSMAASFEGDSYTLVDSVTEAEFEELYQEFGYREALSRDDTSLSYVAELARDLRVLMVDVNTVDSPATVTDSTLSWVERQLQEAVAEGVHVIAVSHQNLLGHSSLFSFGFTMGNSERLLELYEKYHVICNLSGHMHVQHITESERGLPDIASSSIATYPNQYGVLELDGLSAEYHTVPVDVSAWIGESENPDLQDFAAYARTFLWNTSYRQSASEISDDENGQILKKFFADINVPYIAGRMDEAPWSDELYQKWRETAAFLLVYLQSVADDGFQNHTVYLFSCG